MKSTPKFKLYEKVRVIETENNRPELVKAGSESFVLAIRNNDDQESIYTVYNFMDSQTCAIKENNLCSLGFNSTRDALRAPLNESVMFDLSYTAWHVGHTKENFLSDVMYLRDILNGYDIQDFIDGLKWGISNIDAVHDVNFDKGGTKEIEKEYFLNYMKKLLAEIEENERH